MVVDAQRHLRGQRAAQVRRHRLVQLFAGDGEEVARHRIDQPLDARPHAVGLLRQAEEGQVVGHRLGIVAGDERMSGLDRAVAGQVPLQVVEAGPRLAAAQRLELDAGRLQIALGAARKVLLAQIRSLAEETLGRSRRDRLARRQRDPCQVGGGQAQLRRCSQHA